MKLLIGFVNKFFAPKLNLAIYDFKKERLAWVFDEISFSNLEDVQGVNGITFFRNHYIIGYQSNPTKIAVFDLALNIKAIHNIPEIKGLHTFANDGNKLYCASTGTDEIYEIIFEKNFRELDTKLIYSASSEKSDTVHLNSLAFHNNTLVASCFGKKENDTWKGSRNGQIIMIEGDKVIKDNLYQPHTVFVTAENDICFCESGDNKFYFSKNESFDLEGYTRGIAETDGHIFVGISGRRLKSRSKGTINTGVTDHVEESKSGIVVIDKVSRSLIKKIDLSPYGIEIFDITVIKRVPEWISYDITTDLQLRAYEEQILDLKLNKKNKPVPLKSRIKRKVKNLLQFKP